MLWSFRTDWQASAVASWTCQITTDFTPPTITAHVTPPPNAAGWHHTDVQVSFTCTDDESGVASCPGPVTLFSEGEGIPVTGEAVDNVGNRASTTVLVNLDDTAPVVTLYSPAEADVVPLEATEVTIRGSAADGTSGVVSVTCAGVSAIVEGQRYTCTIPVSAGSNMVQLEKFQ